MVICDHDCERCGLPDCLCDELTEAEIRRSDEMDKLVLQSRGLAAKSGKHALPRVARDTGMDFRRWRKRNRISVKLAANLIGVRVCAVRHIEDGGPVTDKEWRKAANYMAEHPEVAKAEAFTPQRLATRLRTSRASSPFRQAIAETFFSCWDALCETCGKSGAECAGCKWRREEDENDAEASAG